MDFDPMDADLAAETMRGMVMDRLKMIPGVVGIAIFMHRPAGRLAIGVIYRDRTAMAQSRSSVAQLRDEAVGKAHSKVRSVEEFEVVLIESIDES
jgi:hypothetical protein